MLCFLYAYGVCITETIVERLDDRLYNRALSVYT